jgi:hypothetical protein
MSLVYCLGAGEGLRVIRMSIRMAVLDQLAIGGIDNFLTCPWRDLKDFVVVRKVGGIGQSIPPVVRCFHTRFNSSLLETVIAPLAQKARPASIDIVCIDRQSRPVTIAFVRRVAVIRHNLLIVFAPVEGTQARLASILQRIRRQAAMGARIALVVVVSGRSDPSLLSVAAPNVAPQRPSCAGREAVRDRRRVLGSRSLGRVMTTQATRRADLGGTRTGILGTWRPSQ